MKIKLRAQVPRLRAADDRIVERGTWRDDRASSTARGYGYQWQLDRADYLDAHPLCVMCQALGIVTAATVVDHVIPHRGDSMLFWNRNNWQPLCASCHSSHKQRAEHRDQYGR